MPQTDDQNTGHRRDASSPPDPLPVWQDPTQDLLYRLQAPCSVNSAPYVLPDGEPDLHDHNVFTVNEERLHVLQQQSHNYLMRRGFVSDAQRQHRSIAELAESYRGSMAWGADKKEDSRHVRNISVTRGMHLYHPHLFWPKADKCNEFVADVLVEAGRPMPITKHTGRPASAQEYALQVEIAGLSMPMPRSMGQRGDIIAQDHAKDGHVGILVHPGFTASANANERGRITINDWGFRSPVAQNNNGEPNGNNSPLPVIRKLL